MAFGLSKNDSKSEMEKADAIVAWIDKKRKGHAVDYYLETKEQCVGRRGSCPDTKFPDGQNSVTLLNAASVNGYTMITMKRPQVGMDEKYDQHVYSDGPQAVVWAVGPLNNKNEVSYHGALKSEGDVYIDFARSPQWNCPQPLEPDTEPPPPPPTTTTTTTTTKKPTKRPDKKPSPSTNSRRKPQPSNARYASRTAASDVRPRESKPDSSWRVPPVVCPADRTFRAQIGPSGGKKGYHSITGAVGWGIAWYINGVLLPELTVERGKTYTFIVEGGDDAENSARTHPLYITDDPEGGYEYKTPAEKQKVSVFAGVSKDRRGQYAPTAKGRLCEYKLPKEYEPEDFNSFEEFQENLALKCERGKQGRLTFRPDKDTPDLLYYQCYTHRYLGWKIHVVDSCQDSLRQEASVQHVRNITFNSFESDFKRGGEKKKLPSQAKGASNSAEDLDVIIVKSSPQEPASEDVHYRPTTVETKERTQYFYTTPEQKSLYKIKTTRPPPPPPKKVVTMESFNLGDVIHSPGHQKNNFYGTPHVSPNSSPNYPSENIRVKVYQPQHSSSTHQLKSAGPNFGEERHKAVESLRSQLSVIQNVRNEPGSKDEVRSYYHYPQNSGLVTRNVSNSQRQRQQSLPHIIALATTGGNSQRVIPVVLQTSGQSRRHFPDSRQNQNPRGHLSAKPPSHNPRQSYLPLILPKQTSNRSSTRSRDVPLVPVVLDKKEGGNLEALQQVLSLLNTNPQNVKIVNIDRPHYSRTRMSRSADHHHGHEHGHDHEDHDHKHEGHEMHHKPTAKSSAPNTVFSIHSLFILMTIHAFRYLSRVQE